mmetsp:Transcript_888/g.968  ORF Transcript_888/g.968 Transcript_888/m.968 type:complete len:105 (-) Transcript_888:276-590(-)
MARGANPEIRCLLGGESSMDVAKMRSSIPLQKALQEPLSNSPIPSPNKNSNPVVVEAERSAPPQASKEKTSGQVTVAISFPRKPPAPETDESRRPEPLSANNLW